MGNCENKQRKEWRAHTRPGVHHARRHVQLIGERRQTQQRFAVQQRLECHAGAARAQHDADGRVRDDRQRREVGLEAKQRRYGGAEQRAVFAAREGKQPEIFVCDEWREK